MTRPISFARAARRRAASNAWGAPRVGDGVSSTAAQIDWAGFGAHAVALQHRYLPQSTTEWLVGDAIDELTITEGGLRYLIDLGKKQNSGLFLEVWARQTK